MPCSCEGYPTGRDELRHTADRAIRAVCDMRTILRRGGSLINLTQETLAWIEEHDRIDAKRIKKEDASGLRKRTRQTALSKLNLDERRVLGL